MDKNRQVIWEMSDEPNGVGADGGDLLMGLRCKCSDDLLFRACHRIETKSLFPALQAKS